MSHSLELLDIGVRLGDDPLIGPMDLVISAGEPVTLMGPSGCGKSSLLAQIGGFLPPAMTGTGRILVDGVDVSGWRAEKRGIGLLFQDDLLFPHMDVAANLAFGLAPEVPRRDRPKAIADALEAAGLPGFEDRRPETLSGGQRARISVMRTLLSRPKALLLDEPFSRLDQALREQFRRFVLKSAADRGLPVLLVTHDPADAAAAGGKVIDIETSPPDGT